MLVNQRHENFHLTNKFEGLGCKLRYWKSSLYFDGRTSSGLIPVRVNSYFEWGNKSISLFETNTNGFQMSDTTSNLKGSHSAVRLTGKLLL